MAQVERPLGVAEPALPEVSSLGREDPLFLPSSSLVEHTSRDKDLLTLSSSPIKGTSRDKDFLSLSSSHRRR